ncbi:MAG: putative molybdenum transport protein [Verrucomicrobia bacterium]|nr:putative molybdenum transport protein [Verrucomicrobiota bacterium]
MRGKTKALSVEPSLRVYRGTVFAFGPGKAALLEEIERTGSISDAAKAMEMSYMKAWKLVQSLDRVFPEPLIEKRRGGHTRGGATLSATGRRVLALYREMEAASRKATLGPAKRLGVLLKGKRVRTRAATGSRVG